MKNRPFHERLSFALHGLCAAWLRESSLRTQTAFAFLAILALVLFRPAFIWWAIIAITIAVVLAGELMNAAFEALVDHLHPEQQPEIRIIKDIAAGGVLVASVGALAIGAIFLFAMAFR